MRKIIIVVSLLLLGLFSHTNNAALVEEEHKEEQADFKRFSSMVELEKNSPSLEITKFIGHSTSKGHQLYQEDDHIIEGLPNNNGLCGVFDGRAGLRAKEIAKRSLQELIRATAQTNLSPDNDYEDISFPQYTKKLLKDIFRNVEKIIKNARKINFGENFSYLQSKEFGSIWEQFGRELENKEECAQKEFWLPRDCSYSCVLLLLFSHGYMFTASLGNCKAIMKSADHIQIISNDHSVDNEKEVKRVIQNEGWSTKAKCFHTTKKPFDWINYKCSRALGHSEFTNNVIHSRPDITSHVLTKDDEFVILGTDGFWEGITEKQACELTHKLKNKKFSLYEITKKLSALSYGYNQTQKTDNSTVMVIDVQKIYNTYQKQILSEPHDSASLST